MHPNPKSLLQFQQHYNTSSSSTMAVEEHKQKYNQAYKSTFEIPSFSQKQKLKG